MSTTTDRTVVPRRAGTGPATAARSPLAWAVAITAVTLALWALSGGLAGLAGGGVATALAVGRVSGLLAALAALGGLVLTARPRWLERSVGLDRMIGWHRGTGMVAAFGTLVHVVAAVAAAGGGMDQLWSGLVDLLGVDWFVAALAAAGLFGVVAMTSWRRLRRAMSYETWHGVHLGGYLAVALAFPHALFSGTTLTSTPVARWWWIGLYVATAAIVLVSRVGGIARSALRPRTEVSRVIPEARGVASLVIAGPGVDALGARAGQFVSLRVLTAGLWWQAHPYSLSAAPQPGALRLTIKDLGDASARTLAVRPGTRVLLEGPYGCLSADPGDRRVVLIGAGVGVAPMRALLEACRTEHEPVVLARARSRADLPLAAETAALAQQRHGVLIPVLGPRTRFPDGNPFTAEALLHNVPDVASRTAFVCGPAALQRQVCAELQRAGVPRDRIHAERFAW